MCKRDSCSNCSHVEHIFGADGGKKIAAEYGMEYLGALPLDMQIRLQVDSGKPTVVADPEGEVAQIYKRVARSVAAKIVQQSKDFSDRIPAISDAAGGRAVFDMLPAGYSYAARAGSAQGTSTRVRLSLDPIAWLFFTSPRL